MRKRKNSVEKCISLCVVSEKTPPQCSQSSRNSRNLSLVDRDVWEVACAGARIYRTSTKYMRIIYL